VLASAQNPFLIETDSHNVVDEADEPWVVEES